MLSQKFRPISAFFLGKERCRKVQIYYCSVVISSIRLREKPRSDFAIASNRRRNLRYRRSIFASSLGPTSPYLEPTTELTVPPIKIYIDDDPIRDVVGKSMCLYAMGDWRPYSEVRPRSGGRLVLVGWSTGTLRRSERPAPAASLALCFPRSHGPI